MSVNRMEENNDQQTNKSSWKNIYTHIQDTQRNALM